MVDISLGLVASLLRTTKSIGERVLPFFFPPRLVVIDYAYGHLKDKGVDRDNYALLVGLKFVNASQKPLLVTAVQASLGGEQLASIRASNPRGILTSKGWRILDQGREEIAEFPFQVPAANVVDDRFVLFTMPDLTEKCSDPTEVKIKAVFGWRMGATASVKFKPEAVPTQ